MARVAIVAALVAITCAALVSRNLMNWTSILTSAASPPSVQRSGVWHWAAAAPGMNIYVAESKAPGNGRFVDAWVNGQHFGSIAGIDKNIVELMQFDCTRGMSRHHVPAPDSSSGWMISRVGTADEGILRAACGHSNSQFARTAAAAIEP
jgi:hypothetical protein